MSNFDYTTKDGRLRVFEAHNGFYVENVVTKEVKGCGDGTQWVADDDVALTAEQQEQAKHQRLVDEMESCTDEWLAGYFGITNLGAPPTFIAGINRDSDRDIDGRALAMDKPQVTYADTNEASPLASRPKKGMSSRMEWMFDVWVAMPYAAAKELMRRIKKETGYPVTCEVRSRGHVMLSMDTRKLTGDVETIKADLLVRAAKGQREWVNK